MTPFSSRAVRTLLVLAPFTFGVACRRDTADRTSCDESAAIDDRIDPAFRKQVAALTPEDRYWARFAISHALPHHRVFDDTTLHDTVLTTAGRSGLLALMAVVLYGDSLHDRDDLMSIWKSGTVLRARPAGVLLADSGLMVLARRVRKRGVLDDSFLMNGLWALTNPSPLPSFTDSPGLRLSGAFATLCAVAGTEPAPSDHPGHGPDFVLSRRVIMAFLLLVLEWEDRSWSTENSLRFLRSLPDTDDARFVDSTLTELREAYQYFASVP